jgi:transcriptional regulator of nitric oxide reductase
VLRLRTLAALACLLLITALLPPAFAGTLDRARLAEIFPSPLQVGERDAALPVWPIFRQELTSTVLLGYVFESIDFAPVPGFSGTPMNLLVALDTKGEFLDVRVLSHHEPVFLEGLGEAPMFHFVEQYKGLSLQQNIKIGAKGKSAPGSANVYIDGVSKATASVRIINQSVLASSLAIARAKLGFAAGRDPDLIGRIRPDVFAPMDFATLKRAGLVNTQVWRERDVEAAFAGTAVEGLDETARAHPDAPFTELLIAHLNVPTVGRNLLNDRAWQSLSGWIEPGDHAFLVASRGRYSFVGDDYTGGAVPDRLTLEQGGLTIEIRDLSIDGKPKLPPEWRTPDVQWRIFKVIRQASLDPSQPLTFRLHVSRAKGQILAEVVRRSFPVTVKLPADVVIQPTADHKTWHSIWTGRAWEIALLLVSLAGLTALLLRPRWLTLSPSRLRRVRLGWSVYTLGFIGWFAQGQLSIVNLTALVQALRDGRSLDFFLYDPMTVLLWAYVALTLLLWGRGTFCGWLCPFGALQELVGFAARRLRLPQWRPHTRTDARLKRLKFAVLAVLLGSAVASPAWTDRLVEVEPFKTSITLMFVRGWPFVLWAASLVLLSAFVYKGWCRWMCPLGGGLALLGRLRLRHWLPRRAECGTPCQTCRHRCEYQAITPQGRIDYTECFQCLDCVAIYESDDLCAPRVLQKRKGRVIPVRPVPAP